MFKKQKIKKTKQAKINKKIDKTDKTDTKGFRVLTDEHDLYQLFGEKQESKEEDFGRLFEETHKDNLQQLLIKEKKETAHDSKSRPLTVSERIKTYPAPQAELDLHGNTALEAEKRTEAFIRNACQKKIRTLRIIVGKGLHSQGKAILRDVVEKKIIRLKQKKWLLGFNWEKKDKKKSGALVVYLLPRKNNQEL